MGERMEGRKIMTHHALVFDNKNLVKKRRRETVEEGVSDGVEYRAEAPIGDL